MVDPRSSLMTVKMPLKTTVTKYNPPKTYRLFPSRLETRLGDCEHKEDSVKTTQNAASDQNYRNFYAKTILENLFKKHYAICLPLKKVHPKT